jgi:serine/threonine protein kinase
LKPENVLVDWKGNARIMDFGLSWVSQEDRNLESGVPYAYLCGIGTPEYTAPETWIDDDFRSPRSTDPVNIDDAEESISSRAVYGIEVDYWAFGCIAFELEAHKSRVRALSYVFVSASDASNLGPFPWQKFSRFLHPTTCSGECTDYIPYG